MERQPLSLLFRLPCCSLLGYSSCTFSYPLDHPSTRNGSHHSHTTVSLHVASFTSPSSANLRLPRDSEDIKGKFMIVAKVTAVAGREEELGTLLKAVVMESNEEPSCLT